MRIFIKVTDINTTLTGIKEVTVQSGDIYNFSKGELKDIKVGDLISFTLTDTHTTFGVIASDLEKVNL